MSKKDTIYSKKMDVVTDFVFDEKVSEVFDDMLKRSIPGYTTIVSMISDIAVECAKDGTSLYDLGCSLGAVSELINAKTGKTNYKIIAVDKSEAMIKRCNERFAHLKTVIPVEFLCDDVCNVDINNASVVIMNFVLQFVPPEKRPVMLKKIYKGMIPGAVFLLSEKVKFDDLKEEDFQTEMYYRFKRMNGYSDTEIEQKKQALENILVPDTLEDIENNLKDAGFKTIHPWYRCCNFTSIIAFKK